jgi:hypothetical protein
MALIAAAMMSCLLGDSATGALAVDIGKEKKGRGEVNVRREGCESLASGVFSAYGSRLSRA